MTAVEHVLGWKGSAEPTTPRRGDTGGHPIGVALNRGWVDVDSVVRTGWDDRLGNTRGPSDERADWLLGRPTTAASSTSNDGPPGMPCRDQRSVGADLTPAYRQLRLGLGSRWGHWCCDGRRRGGGRAGRHRRHGDAAWAVRADRRPLCAARAAGRRPGHVGRRGRAAGRTPGHEPGRDSPRWRPRPQPGVRRDRRLHRRGSARHHAGFVRWAGRVAARTARIGRRYRREPVARGRTRWQRRHGPDPARERNRPNALPGISLCCPGDVFSGGRVPGPW